MNKIDQIKGENLGDRYLAVNPTGHIPMIEDGTYRVLGGNHIIFVYLCKSKSTIGSKLLPVESEQATKGVLGWYHAKMATPGMQLYKMVYQSDKLPKKPTLAHFNKHRKEIIDSLAALESKLIAQPYLCGKSMTIGDIVVFNEISMFMEMCDLKPSDAEIKAFPSLSKWLTGKMFSDPVLQKLDQDMKNAAKGLKKSIPSS